MAESLDQLSPDSGNLFGVIDRDNVFGLNLSVPEHAKHVIKPWDERESVEKYAESGVDDQVSTSVDFDFSFSGHITLTWFVANHTCSLRSKCPNKECHAEDGYVQCQPTATWCD